MGSIPNSRGFDMRGHKSTARRVILTAIVAGVVAAGFGAISMARASGPSHNHRFTLTEKQVSGTFVSVSGKKNGGPGDEFIFHSRLLKHGTKVGTIDAKCTLMMTGMAQCEGTAVLPGGTLAASGLVDQKDSTPDHIAIVGGTGKFAHVSGTLLSVSTGSTTNRDTFNIRY